MDALRFTPEIWEYLSEIKLTSINPSMFIYPQFRSYRYIQGCTKERLICGEHYRFAFYIKKNPCSQYICNNLGVFFSEQPIHSDNEIVLNLVPMFQIKEVIDAPD